MADQIKVDADLDEKIIHQVEYYFGDFNFPRDKFLQEQIKLDDGWIPLSTMLNFKRLATLTTDQDRIISALKKSDANLIEVDDEQKKIRRSVEKPAPLLTESRQKEIQSRTVYCKGFSKDNTSLDKLLEYFKQFGSVENVQMRTYLDKASNEHIFKGSVFVVFSTKDLADEFVKKESIEYDDVPLIIKKQEDYIIDKRKEREDKKRMQKEKLHRVTGKQPKDSKENEENEEEDDSSGFAKGAVVHLKGIPSSTTWEDIRNAVQKIWKAGAKEGEEEEVEVAYVDYRNGDAEAWVRLAEAGAASLLEQRARHAATMKGEGKEAKGSGEEAKKEENAEEAKKEENAEEAKKEENAEEAKKEENAEEAKKEENGAKEDMSWMEVNGEDVEIHVLRGSEENAYLEKAKGAREKRFMFGKSRGKGRRGGGGRKGRGNRGGKRKNTWESGPANKKVR